MGVKLKTTRMPLLVLSVAFLLLPCRAEPITDSAITRPRFGPRAGNYRVGGSFVSQSIRYKDIKIQSHRLLFDAELVLGKDRLVCGCYFYGAVRRRDGARVRSFVEI